MRRHRRGVSMIELALGMAVLALVAGAVAPVAVRHARQEAAQKTSRELLALLDAGKVFYVTQSRWPADLAELRSAGHLPARFTHSAFGTPYTSAVTGSQFQVLVSVPADVGAGVVRLLPLADTVPSGANTIVTAAASVPGASSDSSSLLHRQGTLVGARMDGPLEVADQSGSGDTNLHSRGVSSRNVFDGSVAVGGTDAAGTSQVYVNAPPGTFNLTLESPGNAGVRMRSQAGHDWRLVASDAPAGSLRFYDASNGGDRVIISGEGRVGIGTTTPDTAPLAIAQQGSPSPNAGGGGSLQMGVAPMPVGGDRNSWIQVYNGALMLQPIGNVVGIGYPLDTYLPSHGPKLSVNGTITGTTKNFAIAHPSRAGYTLVHSVLEGPEIAVYYRGQAQLEDGVVEVRLPPYFEALTRKEQRTVQLTPIDGPASLYVSGAIDDGRFLVRSHGGNRRQRFYWEVKAVRADVEPLVVEKRHRANTGARR